MLISLKDFKGNHPVFTPMCIVANPDFEKIENSNFENYFYEPFTDTAKKYAGSENLSELWIKGYNSKIFAPEFHGREHLNVKRWMNLLKNNNEGLRIAFNCHSIGVSNYKGITIPTYLAAFDIDDMSDIINLKEIISTGTNLFEKILGYKAEYFIASNSPEPKSLEIDLKNAGIKFLTRYKFQKHPIGHNQTQFELNWLGKKNKIGQTILTRNCSFEPSHVNNFDELNNCFNEIENAFYFGKPAIISTHRVNYISGIFQKNGDRGLTQLKTLIEKITTKWPNVEFMSSVELANLINNSDEKKNWD